MAKKQIVASTFNVTAAPDDGAKGDRGARLRQTDWAEGQQYLSGADGELWYDVVLYKDMLYLCLKSHTSSSANNPQTSVASQLGYWEKAIDWVFIATKLLLSEKIKAEYIDTDDLVVKNVQVEDADGNVICRINGRTGDASFAKGNILFGSDGSIVCNKGIFKVGIQKVFREISLNDYTTESFKADLTQGLNFIFTKNVGNDTHYMTLPNSLDLDGFESEMIFYGNPGSVYVSCENGLYPFMYNGLRVKQVRIATFPRRLNVVARKCNLIGADYVEWWITNTNDYTVSSKDMYDRCELATSVYYNS